MPDTPGQTYYSYSVVRTTSGQTYYSVVRSTAQASPEARVADPAPLVERRTIWQHLRSADNG
jgi:hypothetical protein